jgi:hypothetical protein
MIAQHILKACWVGVRDRVAIGVGGRPAWPGHRLLAHDWPCHCDLPAAGWGKLTLTRTTPRTGTAWTSDGTSHEHRGLKHRPEHAIRTVPVPPELVTLLSSHLARYGTAGDGRLFPGSRGGILSESTYGRAWHQARTRALDPPTTASGLARRPYDLRHAALSLWLNAGAPPAQIAARAGHSVTVLLAAYTHCIDGQDQITNRQIEHAPHQGNPPSNRTGPRMAHRSQPTVCVTAPPQRESR